MDGNTTMKIILVEDDDGHATLITRNLRRSGIANEVTHFRDGSAVLDYFFKSPNNKINYGEILILLDLNLPGADGYEVLTKLKADKNTHKIPVIVLTTTDDPKEINKCYEIGCNVYVTKPVEYESFCDAVRKLGLMLSIVKLPEVH
jgi:CheY-like chemotaxis protein